MIVKTEDRLTNMCICVFILKEYKGDLKRGREKWKIKFKVNELFYKIKTNWLICSCFQLQCEFKQIIKKTVVFFFEVKLIIVFFFYFSSKLIC